MFQPSMTKMFCLHFWNTFILNISKNWKCTPLNNNLERIYKINYANTICVQKWNGGCAFNNVPLHPWNVFHSYTISTSRTSEKKILKILKTMKNSEKQWKRQLWTLAYILVLQTRSFPLSSIFFGQNQLNFLPKWCHVNTISIWSHLVLDPHLKALGLIYGSQPIRMFHFVGPWTLV